MAMDGTLHALAALSLQEPAGGESGGMGSILVPLVIMGGLFYLILLGPERKQRKKREAMLSALRKGDKVMTTGGLYGTVAAVADDVVTLQVADGVRLRFARSSVQSVLGDDSGAEKADKSEKADKAK